MTDQYENALIEISRIQREVLGRPDRDQVKRKYRDDPYRRPHTE